MDWMLYTATVFGCIGVWEMRAGGGEGREGGREGGRGAFMTQVNQGLAANFAGIHQQIATVAAHTPLGKASVSSATTEPAGLPPALPMAAGAKSAPAMQIDAEMDDSEPLSSTAQILAIDSRQTGGRRQNGPQPRKVRFDSDGRQRLHTVYNIGSQSAAPHCLQHRQPVSGSILSTT